MTHMSRRSFIGGTAAILGGLRLAGCAAGDSGKNVAETWAATQDDSLAVLTMRVAGGSVIAMPGDGWAPRDDYIQLQLSGGSIPGQEIDTVTRNGKKLSVKLKSQDGAASLDLVLTEYRLEGGNVSAVESVLVDYGNGTVANLQKAYE
ncbi:hypothetical protein [Paratractidigestivibacter sp.]|uniref:hypothetical protein n=1 Tax=Paratractidigestivibacter sp. TaxID=2847316 RepID=UPI002AC970DC|nr:hypothetical protein [Paratractidigestivibacter sp.]